MVLSEIVGLGTSSNDSIIYNITYRNSHTKDKIIKVRDDFKNKTDYSENLIFSRDDSTVLDTIAKYIHVKDIMEWNDLEDDKIKPGTDLKILN